MITKVYSQKDPSLLLATIFNIADVDSGRFNAAGDDEILQVSAMDLMHGKSVPAHRHLPNERNTVGTQESWIIWSGSIRAQIYDVDKTHVNEINLGPGDCMILYRGGHSMTVLEDHTKLIEVKNGPYYGPIFDSEKIL